MHTFLHFKEGNLVPRARFQERGPARGIREANRPKSAGKKIVLFTQLIPFSRNVVLIIGSFTDPGLQFPNCLTDNSQIGFRFFVGTSVMRKDLTRGVRS